MAINEQIVVEVTDKVANTISAKLDAIAKSATTAHNAIQQLQAMLSNLGKGGGNGLTQLQTAIAQTTTATNGLTQAFKNASGAAASLGNTNVKLTTQTRSLGSELGSLAGKLAAYVSLGATAKELIELGDAYTSLQNKLQVVTTSQAQVNTLTERLFEIANTTRSSVDATATAFTRFDRALNLMGKSQEDTLRLTQTINEALVNGGATATEASSALLQLSQAFNSGKLQGDEFRSVAENMPVVLDAVSKVLGVNISQVKALGSQGKITSQVLFDAFKSIQDQTDKTFAKSIPTVSQAITVLKNNVTQFWGELNKGAGITSTLAQGIIALGQHLGSVAIVLTAALIPAVVTATSSLYALTAAILTNPFGLAVVAITAVSVALYENRDAMVQWGNESVSVGNLALGAWQTFKSSLDQIFDGLGQGWTTLMNALGEQTSGFTADAIKLFNELLITVVSIPAALKATFDQLTDVTHGSIFNLAALNDRLKDVRAQTRASIADNAQHNAQKNQWAGVNSASTQLRGTGPNQIQNFDAKAAKAAEDRARALAKINGELDKQLSTMFELNPQRTIDQQFDQIQIQLASKKITLNASEAASIKAKITQIQNEKLIQQQLDSIYEDATNTQRNYSNQLAALAILRAKGALDSQQYAEQLNKVNEAYANAVDPLRTFNQGIQDELRILQATGPEQDFLRTIIQKQNELRSQGKSLTDAQTQSMLAQLAAVQRETDVANARNQIYRDTVQIMVDYNAQMTAANQLYDSGVISAGQYASEVNKIRIAMLDTQRDFQSGFESGIRTVIEDYGNVAAQTKDAVTGFFDDMTDAIVQFAQTGKLSFSSLAQSILADMIRIQLKAATSSILSSIFSTGASYAGSFGFSTAAPSTSGGIQTTGGSALMGLGGSMGFASGGYTGNGGKYQPAGIVHKGEFVFSKSATSALGVGNLSALHTRAKGYADGGYVGTMTQTKSNATVGGGVQLNVQVQNNVSDKASVSVQQGTDSAGNPSLLILMDQVEQQMAQRVQSGRGPLNKAVGKAYNLKPIPSRS